VIWDPGVPDAPGRPRRDAAGDDGPQGTDPLGAVLDAGCEGAGPRQPPGQDRGEA